MSSTFDHLSLNSTMRALMATDKIGLHSSLVFLRDKCTQAYRNGKLKSPASPANVMYEMLAASDDANPLFEISGRELVKRSRRWERKHMKAVKPQDVEARMLAMLKKR